MLETKIAIYHDNGCRLVIVADPQTRTVEMHESTGAHTFREPTAARCSAYPDLQIDLGEIFAKL